MDISHHRQSGVQVRHSGRNSSGECEGGRDSNSNQFLSFRKGIASYSNSVFVRAAIPIRTDNPVFHDSGGGNCVVRPHN
jgi:hypothetical protein